MELFMEEISNTAKKMTEHCKENFALVHAVHSHFTQSSKQTL
jgi:hypothetical protein